MSTMVKAPRVDWKLPKTVREAVLKYILRNPGRISAVDDEREHRGNAPYWIYTEAGWCDRGNQGCHTLTAYSAREAIANLREIVPCDCFDCISILSFQRRNS